MGMVSRKCGHGKKFIHVLLQELIGGSSGNNRIVQEAVQNRIIARYTLVHIYLAISLKLAVDTEEGNQEIYVNKSILQ